MGKLNTPWVWWTLGAGALAYLLYSQRDTVQGAVEEGVDTVQAAVTGWQSVQQGPVWVPVLNVAETQYGIPTNLLARMAYQETHFRPEFIDGTKASPAGALGILQLLPKYFTSVRVARPFTAQDTGAQINEAAAELARLYSHYQDWGLAVAAYNWGQGRVDQYVQSGGTTPPVPNETATYVAEVFSDVPVDGATQVA